MGITYFAILYLAPTGALSPAQAFQLALAAEALEQFTDQVDTHARYSSLKIGNPENLRGLADGSNHQLGLFASWSFDLSYSLLELPIRGLEDK